MFDIDFEKLKHEWKTVVWGILSIALELWDVILAGQMQYVEPFIPQDKQWIIHVAVPVGFFLLRRWKSITQDEQ